MSKNNFDFDGEYKKMTHTQLNENGYPLNPMLINRGGQNRYNYGFEYKICGLSTNLSQKGNDKVKMKEWRDEYKDKLYISKYVEGTSVISKDTVRGRICSFTYTDDSALKLKYVWVFDEDTMKKVALIPASVSILKTDYHKEWRNRMNPFSTNMGHLRENEDNDIHGEYMSEQEQMKREQLISMIGLDEKAIAYYDSKFIYNDFKDNCLMITSVWTNIILKALGLKYTVKNKNDIRTSLKKMTTYYFHMTGRDETKPMKIECRMTETRFMHKDSSMKSDFIICSWMDLFCLFDTIMLIRQANGVGIVDESIKKFFTEIVPLKETEKDGKTVFIDR